MKMYVVGNWKMNLMQHAAKDLVEQLIALGAISDTLVEVVVCPPFTALYAVALASVSGIHVGGQNCHHNAKGAFTGEVSAEMLIDSGCSHVILGHSERRRDQHEDDALIGRKAHHALQSGLRPIICVGETLSERNEDKTFDVIQQQLDEIISAATPDVVAASIIAYEPIWAIGTGLAATSQQAEEVHQFIRQHLSAMGVGAKTPLLYGGSVTAENAASLFACSNIDGALVGGASLKANDFAAIVAAAREVRR